MLNSLIRIGTAGWSYEDWNAIVYPERPPRGFDRLSLMASLFDTNEINSTFYRIPPPSMSANWARKVEHNPRFLFTAKLHRGFTHERESGDPDRDAFHLEETLGRLETLPLAVEFRHASWNTDGAQQLLSRHRAAFVNIDQPALSDNLPATEHVTAPIAYFRFHGRNADKWFGPDTSNEERYNYLYSARELDPWVSRIRDAAERAPGGVYAILNNHFRGQAVANALELQAVLTGETRDVALSLRAAYPSIQPITRPIEDARQRRLF
jgi:uncharacterized protein YecE (DUF72 family)